MEHLKCLVGSRLLRDLFLSWIACKIKRESHEAFCIQYLEGFIRGIWNEGLNNVFLKTFGNRTNVKSNNTITQRWAICRQNRKL